MLRSPIGRWLKSVRRDGFAIANAFYWHRLRELMFERYLGIRSGEVIGLKELGLDHDERREHYPTHLSDFRRMERFLRPQTANEVFVDFGAGLGRMLILAAMQPFERVIGVEISSMLVDRARENISRCRKKLRCTNVEIFTADASTFEVPPEVTTIYFNNPFAGKILENVLNNIHLSYKKKPRPLKLVCNLPSESAFAQQIGQIGWLELQYSIQLRQGRRGLVFLIKPDESVRIISWTSDSSKLVCKWRECVRATDNFRAFLQTPEWVRYRWKPIANVFLAVQDNSACDGPIAVTPLVEKKVRLNFSIGSKIFGAFELNSLLLIANVPLLHPSAYKAMCDAVLDLPGIDCLCLEGVPKSSEFYEFLTQVDGGYRQGHFYFYTPGQPLDQFAYVQMPKSYDEYLSKFKGRDRSNLQRKLRLLEKEGGRIRLVRIRSLAEVTSFLATARKVAAKSWQRYLLGLDVNEVAERQQFLEQMAEQGILRSYLLEVGGQVVAYNIGFQLNGIFYFYETCYDPAWARFSVGQTSMYLILQDCFRCDPPRICYFGSGTPYYKRLFSNSVGEEATILLVRNRIRKKAKIAVHYLFRNICNVVKASLS